MPTPAQARSRIIGLLDGDPVPPLFLEIHPTDACTHDCIFCVANPIRAKGAQMSWRQLSALLTSLPALGVQQVLFAGGGDPLAYPQIGEALHLAHDLGLQVRLITNGGGLDQNDRLLSTLAETLTSVRFSLDAASPETHRKLHRPTGPGDTFDAVLAAIRDLVARRDPDRTEIGLSFIAYSANLPEVRAFIDLAAALGVDFVDLKYNFYLSLEANEGFRAQAEALMRTHPAVQQGTVRITLDEIAPRREMPKVIADSQPWPLMDLVAVVEANGEVYPCCHLSGEAIGLEGNAFAYPSFQHFWHSPERLAWRLGMRERGQKCQVCGHKRANQVWVGLLEKHARRQRAHTSAPG